MKKEKGDKKKDLGDMMKEPQGMKKEFLEKEHFPTSRMNLKNQLESVPMKVNRIVF